MTRAAPLRWVRLAAVFAACAVAVPASGQPIAPGAGHVVEGSVRDESGALPGAEVRLVEAGRVAWTDAQGRFRFVAVPAGRVTLDVMLHGFGRLQRVLVVPVAAALDLRLEADLRFAEEVSVTAAPWAVKPLESAQQSDQVAAADVRRERVASVGEALAKAPGVTFIPTGNALGTPVIRGISEHRIRVLNDGVALNHQQFSWRHSPNVEPGFAERIELVRGPASVLYGPDAMGGVINLVHAPLPASPDGGRSLHGELSPGLSTNAGEWAGQGRVEGAFGRLGWRADVVHREGGDITTPRGPLANTDFEQTNATVMGGYSGPWGSVRARWHHWENDTGFFRPTGFRLWLDDDFLAADVHVATRAGVLELVAGRQRNARESFDAEGLPASLAMTLQTTTLRGALQHQAVGRWRGQVALDYQAVDNDTRVGMLVPDYQSRTVAAMLFEEARFLPFGVSGSHRLVVSAGVRGDHQVLEVVRSEGDATRRFTAVTGALGAVWRPGEHLAVAASLGRGWRPPSGFELYGYGVHGGVAAVQRGNPRLAEEANVNAEVSVRYLGKTVQASVAAHRNVFDGYIHLADSGLSQGALPVFVYRQADAVLKGLEATLDVAPRPWLRLGTAWTWLDTRNRQTGSLLPQTPADRLLTYAGVRRARLGRAREAFAEVDVSLVGRGEVSGPDEPLGISTAAYQVAGLKAGLTWPAGPTRLDLAVVVRNLFDREYRDFLWSYKPHAPNPGRDLRTTVTWRF